MQISAIHKQPKQTVLTWKIKKKCEYFIRRIYGAGVVFIRCSMYRTYLAVPPDYISMDFGVSTVSRILISTKFYEYYEYFISHPRGVEWVWNAFSY